MSACWQDLKKQSKLFLCCYSFDKGIFDLRVENFVLISLRVTVMIFFVFFSPYLFMEKYDKINFGELALNQTQDVTKELFYIMDQTKLEKWREITNLAEESYEDYKIALKTVKNLKRGRKLGLVKNTYDRFEDDLFENLKNSSFKDILGEAIYESTKDDVEWVAN